MINADEVLARLMDLGFDYEISMKAIAHPTSIDLPTAADYCLTHNDSSHVNAITNTGESAKLVLNPIVQSKSRKAENDEIDGMTSPKRVKINIVKLDDRNPAASTDELDARSSMANTSHGGESPNRVKINIIKLSDKKVTNTNHNIESRSPIVNETAKSTVQSRRNAAAMLQQDAFYKKECAAAILTAKHEKAAKKLAHERVQRDIEEDRATRSRRAQGDAGIQLKEPVWAISTAYVADVCESKLVIKLPNGEKIERTFPASERLETVFSIIEQVLNLNVCDDLLLRQPFPPCTFSANDFETRRMTLSEAGLIPSVVLVAQIGQGSIQQGKVHCPPVHEQPLRIENDNVTTNHSIEGGHRLNDDDIDDSEHVEMPEILANTLEPVVETVSRSHELSLCAQAALARSQRSSETDVNSAILPTEHIIELPSSSSNVNESIRQERLAALERFQTTSTSSFSQTHIGTMEENVSNISTEQQNWLAEQRRVQLDAFERRQHILLRQQLQQQQQQSDISSSRVPTTNLKSLVKLSLPVVIRQMLNPQSVLRPTGCSEEIADLLIAELIRTKKLNPRVLGTFYCCALTQLDLNAYSFATNELVHSVRFFSSLTRLSLRSCSLVNDHALCSLVLLPLVDLDLCNGKFTDNCCHHIVQLNRTLASLDVSNNKITDAGVVLLAENLPDLVSLNIAANIGIGNLSMRSVAYGMPKLEYLDVARTAVSDLAVSLYENRPPIVKTLRHLSLARTSFGEEAYQLQHFQALESLNLGGCVLSPHQIAFIASPVPLPVLSSLTLPSRECVDDNAVKFFAQLGLSSLELSDCTKITNASLRYIGAGAIASSLHTLLLNSTHIFNDFQALAPLAERLTVLSLARCRDVDDVGVLDICSTLPFLEELDLSSTLISDSALTNGNLNMLVHLIRLNLSRCESISNFGIQHLILPNLKFLNLDFTKVTREGVDAVIGLDINNLTVRTATASTAATEAGNDSSSEEDGSESDQEDWN